MTSRAFLAAILAVALIAPALGQTKKPEKAPARPAPAAAAIPTAGGDPVAARINGVVLHRSDVEMAVKGAPANIQQAPIQQVYPQILNSMVNAILLSQAAKKAKVDEQPAVKQQLAAADTDILADSYVATIARGQITEAKLHEAYDAYVKSMAGQEEVSARHILVPTEQEAKDIIAQLDKGADFATLAKDKTTDPAGKASGGDVGYFTKQDMVPEFANAAFALKVGEYTKTPVHTQFGWHVIKVEDRRAAKPGTYEQVAPQIAQDMTQKIVAQKLQQLHDEGKVDYFDLNGNPIVASAPPPAAPKAAAQQAPAASAGPSLALPGGAEGGSPVPGAPTLSPATAPGQLGH